MNDEEMDVFTEWLKPILEADKDWPLPDRPAPKPKEETDD